MNVQIYMYKKNFDVQKAQRFFKERNIPFQTVDMKKHRPGERELVLFAHKGGAKSLINQDLPKVKEHPISYTQDESIIFDYLQENPEFIKTPLIRDGRRTLIGYDEKTLLEWINA
ncbi:MAG: ArsC/Spx/MgsR family protein [Eubacteriales bacterium]|nr:ArsC/Spx/MgsR family protein [Eubacteriales bacterium]